MNLYIRLLLTYITSFFKPRIKNLAAGCINGRCKLRLYVLPNDLDLNMHMNNGRYPTIMDLGRLDMVKRSGLLGLMLKQNSIPILGSFKIRFRLPLHLFQAYDLETGIVSWDDKWAYMEQRFVIAKGAKKGAVAAIGIVKVGFYSRVTRTMVPVQGMIDEMGLNVTSPPPPQYVEEWQKAEESLRALTTAERAASS